MKKRLLALLCALGILVSITMPASAAFSDVPSSHWAYKDITVFADFGVLNGYPDGSFHPGSSITYAEVATVYFKMAGDEMTERPRAYTDVDADFWAYQAIINMGDFFYHPELDNGNFLPNTYAQRQDIAFFLGLWVSVAVDKELADKQSEFTDYDEIIDFVAPYVDFAVEAGLLNGYEDGTFRPEAPVTRAEFVVMLNRLNDYLISLGIDDFIAQ